MLQAQQCQWLQHLKMILSRYWSSHTYTYYKRTYSTVNIDSVVTSLLWGISMAIGVHVMWVGVVNTLFGVACNWGSKVQIPQLGEATLLSNRFFLARYRAAYNSLSPLLSKFEWETTAHPNVYLLCAKLASMRKITALNKTIIPPVGTCVHLIMLFLCF